MRTCVATSHQQAAEQSVALLLGDWAHSGVSVLGQTSSRCTMLQTELCCRKKQLHCGHDCGRHGCNAPAPAPGQHGAEVGCWQAGEHAVLLAVADCIGLRCISVWSVAANACVQPATKVN